MFCRSGHAFFVHPLLPVEESLLYIHASLYIHRIYIICTDTLAFPCTLAKTASCSTVYMRFPIISLYVTLVQLEVIPVFIGLQAYV